MNLNGHKQWRDGVIAHYGSIEKFHDARTIRIMLGFLIEMEREDKRISETIKSRQGKKHWQDAFSEDRAALQSFKKELEDWLKIRELERI